MVGCKFVIRKEKEEDWVGRLLNCEFFGACGEHEELRKNEKNVYCVKCKFEVCRHCIKSHHSSHPRLQICKYVYHDVVRLQDIHLFLDCSRIQTYKVNGERAVHLNPRPQLKDAKPSTKSKTGTSCEACGRYLQDLPNQFCSIACKVFAEHEYAINNKTSGFGVEGLKEKSNTSEEKESTVSYATNSSEGSTHQQLQVIMQTLKPKPRRNKRKGIPRRSPLL